MIQDLGYGYLKIHKETNLIANLWVQLSKVNAYEFTDREWDWFFKEVLANLNADIAENTRLFQENHVQVLKEDNGESKNIVLID